MKEKNKEILEGTLDTHDGYFYGNAYKAQFFSTVEELDETLADENEMSVPHSNVYIATKLDKPKITFDYLENIIEDAEYYAMDGDPCDTLYENKEALAKINKIFHESIITEFIYSLGEILIPAKDFK